MAEALRNLFIIAAACAVWIVVVLIVLDVRRMRRYRKSNPTKEA